MSDTDLTEAAGSSRRSFLKRAAAAGVAAWTAPVILDSLASPASALTCLGNCYQIEFGAAKTSAACPGISGSNETWKSNKPKTECFPDCPTGSSTPAINNTSKTVAQHGITYDTTASKDDVAADGSGGTSVSSINNNCAVPSGDDTGIVHRLRVFKFDPTVFGTTFGTCKSPQLNAALAGVNQAVTPPTANCVGVGGFTGPSGAQGISSASMSTSGGITTVRFLLDGNYKAMAGQSGVYRFTVGCSCQ